MLGLTVPDAVLISTVVISLLAAWRGATAGASAKRDTPPDPPMAMIGTAIVDTVTLQSLIEAVDRLTETIDHASGRAERAQTGRLADLLEDISRKIDRDPRDHRRR